MRSCGRLFRKLLSRGRCTPPCRLYSLPFVNDRFVRGGRRFCRWRTTGIYCSLLIFAFVICYTVVDNYISSDNQLFHWHVPYTKPPREHLLCVLIPYRDRLEELGVFAPYIHSFLLRQNVVHHIVVLNQTDSLRFNRAALINVGWYEADRLGCDYMVMHDVDLLPLNDALSYSFPGVGTVKHISSPQYHPKYNYAKFIGGILMLTLSDYRKVNGMSNKYWGWGLEDDEFYLRLRDGNLTSNMWRPSNLTTNRRNTFRHVHNPKVRPRDRLSIGDQKKMSRRRDYMSGLDSVRYSIVGRRMLRLDDAVVSVVNVQLHCDFTWTPYCAFPVHQKPKRTRRGQ